MKIIRRGIYDDATNNTLKEYQQRKLEATKGCDKCPCCGETRSLMECVRNNMSYSGIVTSVDYVVKGVFKPRCYEKQVYKCCTCGAKWESELYERAK